MKLNDWLVSKMIIEKDFDQLKEIMVDSENANKLIARKQDNFTIIKTTNDSVIGKYTRHDSGADERNFKILFLKKEENKIEFIFETDIIFDTKVILVLTFFMFVYMIFGQHESDFLENILLTAGMFLFMLFTAYLIRLSVRKGIYNRIHNRWDNMM